MRAILVVLILICVMGLEAIGQEPPRRVRAVLPIYEPPSATNRGDSFARAEATKWLDEYAKDKAKGWKISNWEYKGRYGGPITKGIMWNWYRMELKPPLIVEESIVEEIYFAFNGRNLELPPSRYFRNALPPPAPEQVVAGTSSTPPVKSSAPAVRPGFPPLKTTKPKK